MLAAAVAFAACSKPEDDPQGGSNNHPTPTPGATYKIECTNSIEGSTWKTGDAIGLFSSTPGVTASNVKCTLEDADGQKGLFTTPALNLVAGENSFVAYAPYSAEVFAYNNVIYNLTIAQSQIVKAGEIPSLFSWGKFTGVPVTDEKFQVTISPLAAVAKVSVSTTELAGYSVKSIQVTDLTGEAELGGVYNLDVATGELKTNESFKLVSANVASPVALVADQVQDFYLQIKPGEYDGLYVSLTLVNEEEKSYTLILKKTNVSLAAGQVTNIQAAGLTSTTNEADWYASDDTRFFPEGAWGYGQSNTFLIQCKNGRSYKNATYQPDSNIPDEVSIDIRARGNLAMVQDPKGATFEWYTHNGKIYAPRTTDYESSEIDPTLYEVNYDGEYTVKVKNTGAYAGAPILLMKKNGKVLWSWTFWNIAADGTKLEAVPVQGSSYKIANMDIGQATTQFETWTKNQNSNANSAGPDVVFRTICYYQHGRTMPTFWTNWWTFGPSGNLPFIEGPLSLEESVQNPVGQIHLNNPGTSIETWGKENNQFIWGGSGFNDRTVADKTVFDPCPEGWKVPAPEVGDILVASGITQQNITGAIGLKFGATGDVVYLTQGYVNGKIDSNSGRMQTMGGGQNGTASYCKYGMFWTSMCGSLQGYAVQLCNKESGETTKVGSFNKAVSAAVRCVKDEK